MISVWQHLKFVSLGTHQRDSQVANYDSQELGNFLIGSKTKKPNIQSIVLSFIHAVIFI